MDETSADELRRQAIFLALVHAQDRGVPVPESRREVMARFGLGEAEVMAIEREGMDNGWPPL
jgi:hypothetical protein